MKAKIEDPITEGLLAELLKEEDNLNQAQYLLREARVRFNVASRKYAAVRDMVVSELGGSPYRKDFKWPTKLVASALQSELGKNRFLHMKAGDAVIAALKEVDEPLTLEEIVERLGSGGIRFPGPVATRMINAALMKTSGIEKTEEGKYRYKAEEEPDDIPF